ncbi:hypothetical protein KQI68_06790 [Peptoniphilus sp. MSJ-1]|uniref:Uncharacterized protein n=1 Tax=Peptoniphilus ovalis TaxID=2841503 RepID=A0ABS6FH94_9FIRM|nr:hypothetical protein [Peptoniphilus ovalis]MBU5669545.1 hypothetical protein [Peptoniphilus ovalis]
MGNVINLDNLWLSKEIGQLSYKQGQLEELLKNKNLGKIARAIMQLELKHCVETIDLYKKLFDEINEE